MNLMRIVCATYGLVTLRMVTWQAKILLGLLAFVWWIAIFRTP
jgi:hypothetical protein